MRDPYEYDENEFPLAYLITFRTYGTWLHGDERKAVGRNETTAYGAPKMPSNSGLHAAMQEEMNAEPVIFTRQMRESAATAIEEVCRRRSYSLYAQNVRSNHAHMVLSAQSRPERIADALKAAITKKLREERLVGETSKVWSRGRSRRYLWKPHHVQAAIDYVLFGQGLLPFELPE